MSGVTLVSADPRTEERLAGLFGKSTTLRRVSSEQWHDPAEAAMDVCAADPELLVIGADMAPDKARQLVAEVDRQFPTTTMLVLVAEKAAADQAVELLRLGARDVLSEKSIEKHQADLDRLLEVARTRRRSAGATTPALRRRVITVVSPKGGTGKTTMATNLAVGLARRQPNQVVLVDLDLQFGDCASGLGLQPESSLVEAISSLPNDRNALKVFLTLHPSGLAVLSPPEDLAKVDAVEPDQIKALIAALAEEFPFVVIDTSAGIDPACVAALELSTDLLLVTTTDVPSIRAMRRQVEALDRIGMVSPRRTLVLNRANAKVGVSVDDVQSAIGMEATFRIPSSRLIPMSTNEGQPVIERDSGNVAARFDEVVSSFAPRADEPRGGSLFRSLRKDR